MGTESGRRDARSESRETAAGDAKTETDTETGCSEPKEDGGRSSRPRRETESAQGRCGNATCAEVHAIARAQTEAGDAGIGCGTQRDRSADSTGARPVIRARALLIGLLALVALAWSGVADRAAAGELDAAFKRSFATFAIARSLNGAISLVQDADVSMSPAGVGLTVSPGELLDPLNDLLEQFSTLAFAALTALGIQKFALHLSASLLLNALLTLAVAFWLLVRHWPPLAAARSC